MDLDKAIRKISDFPKKGILFYDITSLFTNTASFKHVISSMLEKCRGKDFDGIIAIESRGFLFGSPLALEMEVPLLLARKKGKLPHKTISQNYELEYGSETLEMHKCDLLPGKKWLIVDDLIATGGSIEAVIKIVEKQNSEVAGIFSVIGLPFLDYRKKLSGYDVHTLIEYNSEKSE